MDQITMNRTSDRELVQMGGLHAYLEHEEGSSITIENRDFEVIHTEYNHPTGLDALTVQNLETGEYTVVFVGTDVESKYGMQDVKTNVQLLTGPTPAQLEAGVAYVESVQVELGIEVESLAGNSLGGSLANAAAVAFPHMRAVTLNPAPLPAGLLDPDTEYENMTNYLTENDILTTALRAGRIAHQVPGKHVEIYQGVPGLAQLVPNHTGYIKDGNRHVPTLTIGEYGQPGYGHIYMDADRHIVTSIWTGQPLYGQRSERIQIDYEQLSLLGAGLEPAVIDRLTLAQTYLTHAMDIVEHQRTQKHRRVNELREAFLDMFEQLADRQLLFNIHLPHNELKKIIQRLHTLLDQAEAQCASLDILLNSPPMELVESLFNTSVDVASLFAPVRNYLYELEEKVDELSSYVNELIMDKVEDLLKGGQKVFLDVVVDELAAHHELVGRNQEQVLTQVKEFRSQVSQTASEFEYVDHQITDAVRQGGTVGLSGPVQSTNIVTLEESPYMLYFMKFKELHRNMAIEGFRLSTYPIVVTLVGAIDFVLGSIKLGAEAIQLAIREDSRLGRKVQLADTALRTFFNYESQVIAAVNRAREQLDDFIDTVQGLRNGLSMLQDNYPTLVNKLRPYVDSALFRQEDYQNVYFYNHAARSLIRESEVVFDDVYYHFQMNRAKSIRMLREVSNNVVGNLQVLDEQVKRCSTG
ncbi:SA1320 family protein [Halalkalibacter sp. AB-rgal2]|uniref:SA1320 family protein n=1 Tax=Halalkalibacter sp. AB-rgal2 TaxID=3242695 RepID=UPI00359DD183